MRWRELFPLFEHAALAKLKDGRTITVQDFEEPFEDGEGMVLVVFATLDGREIGTLRFDRDHDIVRGVNVEQGFRRLGVATALYDHLEKVLGYEVHPSDNLAPDGVKFWANREERIRRFWREQSKASLNR